MQGLRDKVKRVKVFRYIRSLEADIVFLQEVHCTKNNHKIFKNEWGGRCLFSDGESNARGVVTMFRRDLDVEIVKVVKDNDGRRLDLTAKFDHQTLRLINLYAPNTDEPSFFAKVLDDVTEAEEDHIIVAGDMNVVLDNDLDKKGGKPKSSKSAGIINNFLDENDWLDVWRHFNPNRFWYTWKGGKPLVMTRLDYVFMPLGSLAAVADIEILPATVSDHSPIVMRLDSNLTLRGPGYWKLNTRHLEDSRFVNAINETLDVAISRHTNVNPLNAWERINAEIKYTSIQITREITKSRNEKVDG